MAFERMNLEDGAGGDFVFRRGNNFGDRLVALGQQYFIAGLNPLDQLGSRPLNSLAFAIVVMV